MRPSPNGNYGPRKSVEGSDGELRSLEWPPFRRVRGIAAQGSDTKILPRTPHHRIADCVVVPNLWPCPSGPPAGNEIGHIDRRPAPKEVCLPSFSPVRSRLPDVTSTIVPVNHDEGIRVSLAIRNLKMDVGCLHSVVTIDRRIFKSAQGDGSPSDKDVPLTSDADPFPVIGRISGLNTLGRGSCQRK